MPDEFEFNIEHKRDLLYAGLLTPFKHLEYENKKKKDKAVNYLILNSFKKSNSSQQLIDMCLSNYKKMTEVVLNN